MSDLAGGGGTGCRARRGCSGGRGPVRPRGAAVSTTERPRGEPSCPNARSQRVTTHGAAPPRLPKPHLRGQGPLCPDSGVFLLLSLLPRSSNGKGSSQSTGTLRCLRPVPPSRQPGRPCHAGFSALPCLNVGGRGSSHSVSKLKGSASVGRSCGLRDAVTACAISESAFPIWGAA